MIDYIVRRLLTLIPTILGVLLIVSLVLYIIPGDPVRLMLGQFATEDEVLMVRQELGLEDPFHIQFFRYLFKIIQGDMGRSIISRGPVFNEIASTFPNTALLVATAIFISLPIGILAGIIAAVKRRSIVDGGFRFTATFGVSIPDFWFGLMLILLFSVTLRWLPTGGMGGPQYLILPALTMMPFLVAYISRLTRASMLDVLSQNYVTAARAKGVIERTVMIRHALKNALIPVVTMTGILMGMALAGTVVIETVFSYPGMGRLLVSAAVLRDYPLIQGLVLFFSLIFLTINLIVDLLYAYLDPRIRYT